MTKYIYLENQIGGDEFKLRGPVEQPILVKNERGRLVDSGKKSLNDPHSFARMMAKNGLRVALTSEDMGGSVKLKVLKAVEAEFIGPLGDRSWDSDIPIDIAKEIFTRMAPPIIEAVKTEKIEAKENNEPIKEDKKGIFNWF